jgi:hypothetical protein
VIESYFPGRVRAVHNVTGRELRNILTEQKFDIVHMLAVISKNGDLVLDEYDQDGSEQSSKRVDGIPAEGFAKLIETSKTSLVFLATCDSLPLAASLARKTNMMASMDFINVDDVVEWEDCFYRLLSRGYSVSQANQISKSMSTLPMLLIPADDVAFAPEPQ